MLHWVILSWLSRKSAISNYPFFSPIQNIQNCWLYSSFLGLPNHSVYTLGFFGGFPLLFYFVFAHALLFGKCLFPMKHQKSRFSLIWMLCGMPIPFSKCMNRQPKYFYSKLWNFYIKKSAFSHGTSTLSTHISSPTFFQLVVKVF